MDTPARLLAVALATTSFLSFAWAIRRLFLNPRTELPARMRALGILGAIFFLGQVAALLAPGPGSEAIRMVGFALYGIGLGGFWWAVPHARRAGLAIAFSDHDPRRLIVEGPYRFVRHPFYASYLAFWVAGTLVSQRWWLLASVLTMGWFYLAAIRQEETAFLKGPLGAEYRAYRARTGALLPTLGLLTRRG